MKFKSILLTAVATINLATATMAQVPNYVPTNGLVGWWPFNGNANDESSNNNNGSVNGATLTSDRFGNASKAYNFNGLSNFIQVPSTGQFASNTITINGWMKIQNINTSGIQFIVNGNQSSASWSILYNNLGFGDLINQNCSGLSQNNFGQPPSANQWINITYVITPSTISFYKNGTLVASQNNTAFSLSCGNNNLYFGLDIVGNPEYYSGSLDDIGIWNRALTQLEITDLYNAVNCANNTSVTPQTNSLTLGSTATFTASTSDPNPSYVWQSDFGQGFQTLNNFGNYSGANSSTLNISNVQLSEHNQPIRVITTSGNCIDTSNVAVISILDTCITNVTVYDTLLTNVTDTLVINTQITGINPPNNLNTLKVFPNPASTHITIDYGNFNAMSGYTLSIVNSVGQTVFTTPINQQTSYIDLSTWSGNGIYFVQLIDPQNNTIENRKIVIQ
jgi:hypothetical protein